MIPTFAADMQTRVENFALLSRLQKAMNVELVAESLARQWTWARNRSLMVDRVELVRVTPRKSDHFVLEYSVQLYSEDGDEAQTLFGELVAGDVHKHCAKVLRKLRKQRRRGSNKTESVDGVEVLQELGLVVRLPGVDERLIGLCMVNDAEFAASNLDRLLGDTSDEIGGLSVKMLGHRLGNRATAKVQFLRSGTDAYDSVIARFYKSRSQKPALVFARMQALTQLGFDKTAAVRIPEPITMHQELQAVIMEDVSMAVPLPGLTEADLDDAYAGAGDAIARLHRLPLKVEKSYTVTDEIKRLQRWVDLLGRIFPELAHAARSAVQKVVHRLESLPVVPAVLTHRNFHERQVLYGQDGVVLTDFDTLCLADPAVDLGNFLAQLDFSQLQVLKPCTDAETLFLDGYHADSTILSRAQAWRQSASLRLACLYAFWPGWQGVVRLLLEDMEYWKR